MIETARVCRRSASFGRSKSSGANHSWLPIFRHGSQLAARKSSVRATVWSLERQAAWSTRNQEMLVRLHILLSQLLKCAAPKTFEDIRADVEMRVTMAETIKTITALLQAT